MLSEMINLLPPRSALPGQDGAETARLSWPANARHRRAPVRRSAAFTLIELLTVIAIIGILAAILIPTTSSARTAAKKAKTRGQFSQWGAAIEAFRQCCR